jgi:hypothetical protein
MSASQRGKEHWIHSEWRDGWVTETVWIHLEKKLLSYFGNQITIPQIKSLLLSHYTNLAIPEQSNRNLYAPSSTIYKSVARKLNFRKYLAFH